MLLNFSASLLETGASWTRSMLAAASMCSSVLCWLPARFRAPLPQVVPPASCAPRSGTLATPFSLVGLPLCEEASLSTVLLCTHRIALHCTDRSGLLGCWLESSGWLTRTAASATRVRGNILDSKSSSSCMSSLKLVSEPRRVACGTPSG